MAPQKPTADEYDNVNNVKELLDKIGQKVHDEIVKNGGDDAKKYIKELEGDLKKAKVSGVVTGSTIETCDLVKQYYYKRVNGGDGNGDPCKGLSGINVKRFSDKIGGQCTDSKMRSDGIGACAPFRRLHLCHHNLESIDTTSTTNKLLLEVCMAAKYEGGSIKTPYTIHQLTNEGSQLCTVLARSFADIGDIIRGRDIFRGNDEEKEKRKQLEKNLKKIFGNIYKELKKKKKGRNGQIEARYKKDEDPYYYQLREDWWNANRQQVWKAITCNDDNKLKDASYFRTTCNDTGRGGAQANNKCRCKDEKGNNTDQVPTYFDYVPQFLRWFEEWAEDFCRLRKHRLKDAIDKCRGGSSNDKYCSGNGFDCTKTVRGNEHFVVGDCHDCLVACSPFVKWLDNQKLEFLKQKEKYGTEITGGGSGSAGGSGKKRNTRGGSNVNGYEKKFYKKLENTKYKDVENFLDLLNKEDVCKKNTDTEGGQINFKNVNSGKNSGRDSNNKTFCRTKYCEACPWCGVSGTKGNWTPKGEETCGRAETKIYNDQKKTDIPILTGDKGQSDIFQKYRNFCDSSDGNNGDQIKNWQCYYDENKESGQNNDNCVEGTWDNFTQGKQTVKSYNAFFWDWVYHMLHDSLDWRKQLGNCINKNKENTCKTPRKCNKECTCFAKWVVKKKTEWDKIKEHFGKQTNIGQQQSFLGSLFSSPSYVLKEVLKDGNLLQNIKDTHADADDIERIGKMLKEEENQVTADGVGTGVGGGVAAGGNGANGKHNTKIDEFLNHEKGDAETCKDCKPPPKPPPASGLGRSDTSHDGARPQPRPGATLEEEDEEDEDEDEEEEEEGEEEQPAVNGEATQQEEEKEPKEEKGPKVDGVKPCQIVKELFSDTTKFSDACKLKYGPGGKENFPNWKCISDTTTTSSGGKDGATGGSICVPPRRRKLYIKKIVDWAEKYNTGATGNTQVDGSNKGEGEVGESTNKQSVDGEQQKGPPVVSSEASSTSGSNTVVSGQAQTQPQVDAASKNPKEALLKAFVESAAVETFFLWDRYKKIKQKERKERKEAETYIFASETSDDPETSLKSGNIPPDFLRLMFYTLGDYRDICTGDEKVIQMLKDSGDENIETINNKIKEILEKVDNKQQPRKENSVKDPKAWWSKYAEHVWNGMICALTYDTNSGDKGQTPKQDQSLKDALLDNNKPKSPNDYDKVELKEENSGAKSKPQTESTSPSGENTPTTLTNPKLSDFVLRPPYFRWLHEWGSDFCGTRKKMLGKIKHECKVDENSGSSRGGKEKTPKCSCYGELCDDIFRQEYNVLPDLMCQDCGNSCRKYKKWIRRKKDEFTKQSGAYDGQKNNYVNGQKQNCKEESGGGGNGFCGKLKETCTEAKDFLKTLGSCKIENGVGKTIFDNTNQTFVPAENCKPCSQFTVKCKEKGHCDTTKGGECDSKNSITANDIENKEHFIGNVYMVVSDKDANGFEGDGLQDSCGSANIFKGIRKEQWTCHNVCGYVVCKRDKVEGQANGEKQIITIKALLHRWLQYFLEDYNKINKKLNTCTNDKGSKCIRECVDTWISNKQQEWEKIKEHYQKQYGGNDSNNSFLVKTILEEFKDPTEVNKAIKPCKDLNKFQDSKECAVTENAGNGKPEKKDVVLCLLDRLKKKATSCPAPTSDKPKAQCQESPSVEDDDEEPYEDLLLQETEEKPEEAKKKMMPKICEGVVPQEAESEEKGACEKAAAPSEPKKAEEESGSPPAAPAAPATPVKPAPAPADEPFDSTILQTTIPFGVALALGSIAFLFLK
ncbi:hypothetical protein PFTANZ_06237, partial [Plasmodium falciparum Tanzania (2000708)]